MFKNESQQKINDDWRTNSKKTQVDKVHSDACTFDA